MIRRLKAKEIKSLINDAKRNYQHYKKGVYQDNERQHERIM